MLARVIERAQAIPQIDRVVVATTGAELDRAILPLAASMGVATYSGSEDDVLDRVYQAARQHGATTVMRLTGDCPLLDPVVSGRVLSAFCAHDCDYAANVHPPSFPDGLDTEVMSFDVLERAWMDARLPSEREHVTPYIWTQPERFRLLNVLNELDYSHYRWTVDEPADLTFVRGVYAALAARGATFGMADILTLLGRHPELAHVNAGHARNAGYVVSLLGNDDN